ncbi:MAG: hypothetical protein AAF222_10090 [Pseudomonadota bacterium]
MILFDLENETIDPNAKPTIESEAIKYELHGLRSEMIMYMQQSFQIENLSLTAAAFVYAYPFSNEILIQSLIAFAPIFVLWMAYGRIKTTRHRISRLGMYIYLTEKRVIPSWGWEHFVYRFRNADIPKIESDILERIKLGYPDQVDPSKIKNSDVKIHHGTKQRKIDDERKAGLEAFAKEFIRNVKEIDDDPGVYMESVYSRWKIIFWIAGILVALKLTTIHSDSLRFLFYGLEFKFSKSP